MQNTKTAPSEKVPLLHVQGLTKKFGDFTANDSIDLKITAGKVHALLGENGAGKSTLVKMIYGALQPTAGSIFWQGQPVSIASPAEARAMGIGMVFQHFSLFEALTVAENISLALPASMRQGDLNTRIESLSRDYGLSLNADALVADISVGERQRIEIVRCLLQKPSLLIMDEPTAVLTPQEADDLFATLTRLTQEGCAVLYISHRLEEVKKLCQEATILRHGKIVAEADPQLETAATLAQYMVGESVEEVHRADASKVDVAKAEVLLAIKHLNQAADTPFGIDLIDLNLQVHSGEILAIAGIAGNGQGELFSVLSGETLNDDAQGVVIQGHNCGHLGINERRQLDAAFVPEERNGHGAIGEFFLSDNILLSHHALGSDDNGQQTLVNRTWLGVDKKQLNTINKEVAERYDVRSTHINPEASSLSGGNLQKFVVGRELYRQPKVLVINQPTWGVDAGAAVLVRQALIDLANKGAGLLIISQDLDEIFSLADRIAVISRGQFSEAFPVADVSREAIGLLMSGAAEKQSSVGGS